MATATEPERQLIRRVLPFVVPAMGVAFVIGDVAGGLQAGWSALIGVVVVAANFLAGAFSMAWAATVSVIAVFAVGLGGFLVRMAAILGVMLLLNRLDWFSPLSFALTVVPATILLLGFEMKVTSGRMQADMWYFREPAR